MASWDCLLLAVTGIVHKFLLPANSVLQMQADRKGGWGARGSLFVQFARKAVEFVRAVCENYETIPFLKSWFAELEPGCGWICRHVRLSKTVGQSL
jgi:hypothetical protein